MALTEVIGATGGPLGARLPHQVAVVLGDEVPAAAAVADIAHHLVPDAIGILAFGEGQGLRHRHSWSGFILPRARRACNRVAPKKYPWCEASAAAVDPDGALADRDPAPVREVANPATVSVHRPMGEVGVHEASPTPVQLVVVGALERFREPRHGAC